MRETASRRWIYIAMGRGLALDDLALGIHGKFSGGTFSRDAGLGLWDNGGHGKVFFDGSMELR
jgi:hypothetical protein